MIGLTLGQQSWLRLLNIDHHEVMAGTEASMAPGFETLSALKATKASAERHRAAALDRTHDLQLVEADVSGIGQTPRRPAGRNMAAGRYAGGWSFLLFLGFLRGWDSRSSGLSMPAIMPVATRV